MARRSAARRAPFCCPPGPGLLPAGPRAAARRAREHPLAAIEEHHVARSQLPAAAQLQGSIHPHVPTLDAQLGLAAGGHQAMELQKLIELHRVPNPTTLSVPRCSHLNWRQATAACGTACAGCGR